MFFKGLTVYTEGSVTLNRIKNLLMTKDIDIFEQ